MVLHDDVHDQFFIMNVPLFLERCRDEFSIGSVETSVPGDSKANPYTSFVLLDDEPRLVRRRHDRTTSRQHLIARYTAPSYSRQCPRLLANALHDLGSDTIKFPRDGTHHSTTFP